MLKLFRRRYPGIGLTLSIEDNKVLQQALKRELLDITFTFCRTTDHLLNDRSTTWLELDTYPLCVVLSSEHPLAGRDVIEWDEIRSEKLLSGYMPGNQAEQNIDKLDALRINDPVFLLHSTHPPIYSDDALMPMIEAGYGIAILPSFRRRWVKTSRALFGSWDWGTGHTLCWVAKGQPQSRGSSFFGCIFGIFTRMLIRDSSIHSYPSLVAP